MNKISPADLFSQTAANWILNLHEGLRDLCYRFFKCFIYDDRYQLYITGLKNTLILTFFALLLGIVLGVVVSLVRVSWDKTHNEMHGPGKAILGFFNGVSKVYLTVIRGTPVVVQLLIMNFVIFASSRNKVLVGALSFGINSGAYVAEIVRSGIQSIDPGQMEAGRSLGLNYVQTMWNIIIPQAVKNILPALGNEFIALLKETSIVNVIGMKDITKWAINVQGRTYQAFMPFIGIALVYLVMVIILSKLVNLLERRLRSSER